MQNDEFDSAVNSVPNALIGTASGFVGGLIAIAAVTLWVSSPIVGAVVGIGATLLGIVVGERYAGRL